MTAVIDSLKRPLKDLRISITDRCNLRCQYCMPEELFGPGFAFSPRQEILTYEEINRAVEAFLPLGIRKIRITGETLLRRERRRADQAFRKTAPSIWTWRSRPTGWDSRNSLILFAKPVLTASTPALTRSIRQSPGK